MIKKNNPEEQQECTEYQVKDSPGGKEEEGPPLHSPFWLLTYLCGDVGKEKKKEKGEKQEIRSGSVSLGARRSNAMLDKWAERLAGQISDKVGEKGFAVRFLGFDRWTVAD